MIQQKDIEEGYIHVCIEPIGMFQDVPLVNGQPDMSVLSGGYYGKRATGIRYNETSDQYDLILTEEGQKEWREEVARIGQYMKQYGTANE